MFKKLAFFLFAAAAGLSAATAGASISCQSQCRFEYLECLDVSGNPAACRYGYSLCLRGCQIPPA